jgi:hypothetical protein
MLKYYKDISMQYLSILEFFCFAFINFRDVFPDSSLHTHRMLTKNKKQNLKKQFQEREHNGFVI